MTTTEKTQQEIDSLEDLCKAQISKGGSKYSGMTYEEGILNVLDWLFQGQPNPMD